MALAGLFLASCSSQVMKNSLNYPETKKVEHTDEYFGTKVADYLNQIPFREEIRAQLKNIWNYEKISAPFKEGDYTYFYKNDGLQAQSVLYRTDKNGNTEVFLDPNKFSEKGTTSMSGLSFNKKGTLAAYNISEGGSDWQKIVIINAITLNFLALLGWETKVSSTLLTEKYKVQNFL